MGVGVTPPILRRCVMLPILLLLVLLLHYGEGKCCPNFRRWCRRYDAVFTAVGAAYYTTARVNAAQIFAVGRRHYDAVFTAVGAAITLRRG